jgi:peptidoglycan/xylan/chitin deacetylase (PgdA/CDA1 family)
VEQGGAILRRAAAEGHALQIHSWDHDARDPQIERCARKIKEVTGIEPGLYHAPGGIEFKRIDGELLQLPVINPADYLRPGEKELQRRVLPAAKPGEVILLHAGVSDTLAALPQIARSLRARGLDFEVMK